MAFGAAALLISLSVIQGFERTLSNSLIAFTGDIQVASVTQKPLGSYETSLGILRALHDVRGASPYVAREAIVRSGSGLEGIRLKGVVPSLEVSSVTNMMVDGKFSFPLHASDTSIVPVILGDRLARKLRLKRGDTLVLFVPEGVPSPTNPPTVRQAVLTGTYRTGIAEYDDMYAYTSMDAAQILFGLKPDQVTGFDVMLRGGVNVDSAAQRIDTRLGYPYYSRTVQDMFRHIFSWLDLQRRYIPIVLTLIIIVAVFNVLSTLLMVVLEKTESIGVLSTLGATPWGIVRIFVGQGLLIGCVGTAIGCAMALGFTFLQSNFKLIKLNADIYFVNAVPVSFNVLHYVAVVAIAILLSILSTLIPALVAARLHPVSALRFR